MATKDPPQADDDAALFRQAIGPVREIAPPEQSPARRKPKPRARQFERDEAEALRLSREDPFNASDAAIGERLQFRQPGVGVSILRKLRRGQYSVQDEIDLHGANAAEALDLLRRFLHEAEADGHHCVRIVHGKGLNSRDGIPVLKVLTDRFLRHHGKVLAFVSTPDAGGGSGAVLVLLRD